MRISSGLQSKGAIEFIDFYNLNDLFVWPVAGADLF
jgi:hypothetical protein